MINGSRIKELRLNRGWDQYELAEQAGLASSMISRLERNLQTDYKLSAIVRIAKVLGVSVDSLLSESYKPSTQAFIPQLQHTLENLSHQPASIQVQVDRLIRAYVSTLTESE